MDHSKYTTRDKQREGDHAVVLIEVDGKWREIIRERYDSPFSHIWEDQP